MRKPSAKQIRDYRDAALAILIKHGATEAPKDSYREFCLQTKAGPLFVSIKDDWLACLFEDVARARAAVPGERLNPHSGKWNWMQGLDDLQYFDNELGMLAPLQA
jgi:hypothetical protein